MGESRLKRLQAEEELLSCAGIQTAGGRVRARWEADAFGQRLLIRLGLDDGEPGVTVLQHVVRRQSLVSPRRSQLSDFSRKQRIVARLRAGTIKTRSRNSGPVRHITGTGWSASATRIRPASRVLLMTTVACAAFFGAMPSRAHKDAFFILSPLRNFSTAWT